MCSVFRRENRKLLRSEWRRMSSVCRPRRMQWKKPYRFLCLFLQLRKRWAWKVYALYSLKILNKFLFIFQPENKGKAVVKAEAKAQGQKNTIKNKSNKVQVSPGKSSDKENHSTVRIKTTAGYAIESLLDKDEFTTFKNSAGPVQVELSTPKQKYFKEISSTPHHSWSKELPCSSKGKREKNPNPNPNPAKSSALRFKKEIFGRNRK